MITIELDIFSGLPNPIWTLTKKEEKELIDRVIADPSLTQPPKTVGGLGYRGFTVSACSRARRILHDVGLPSLFYVNAKKSRELQKSLVDSIEAERTTSADVLQQADNSIQVSKETIEATDRVWYEYWATHTDSLTRWADSPETENSTDSSVDDVTEITLEKDFFNTDPSAIPNCPTYLGTPYNNLSNWNAPNYNLFRNNCYNFAANWRTPFTALTCTKAQPGLRSRMQITNLSDCGVFYGSVKYGALLDGLREQCFTGYKYLVALVLAPGRDYHWYRLCTNGFWCHKAGHCPARNYDDSFRLITDPSSPSCNRGIYTVFCGFMFVPYGLPVASPHSTGCPNLPIQCT